MIQKRDYYSHSSLKTYLNCPLQFKFKYYDGLPDKTSIEAFLGSAVHKALEVFYKIYQKHNIILPLKKLLNYYKKYWLTNWDLTDIHKVRKDISNKEYFLIGVECIKFYYQNHFKPNEEKTIAIEKEINITINNIKFKGFIDRLTIKKDGSIEIHDYKTGRYVPSIKEQQKDMQLALYQLAINHVYPKKKIKLIWYYLQKKKIIKIEKTEEELKELQRKLIKTVRQIEKTEDFEPKQSHLCNWCAYKSLCPLYKHNGEIKTISLS